MNLLNLLFISTCLVVLGSCSVQKTKNDKEQKKITLSGPIEIDEHTFVNEGGDQCTISGQFIDENNEPVMYAKLQIEGQGRGAQTDENGKFELKNVAAGEQTLVIMYSGMETCTIGFTLKAGDHFTFTAHISLQGQVELLKPIIYIYPTDTTDVQVKLDYDGKITTTYPKLPIEGWNVTAYPDGTLIDENKKQFYALYWEGIPTAPLTIPDGFVVSKVETVNFLEENLAKLGLNARESNEFIIFWLPVLEKNEFNLIHFSNEAYLNQAKLIISPTPETIIRIAMVFQGLDKAIEFPAQDLSPLEKTRKGFTVVEWGGQELPKNYPLGI